MKKINILIATFLFVTFSYTQDVKKDDWIRVQSDDGEFSIEVPAKYGYFYDKDGTTVSDTYNRYELKEMCVFNTYFDSTLLSFETYRADKNALKAIEDANEKSSKWQKTTDEKSEIKRVGYKISQHISKNDKQYTVRQYFRSKKYIYVLTASTRSVENAVMKRFFNSLVFAPNADGKILSENSRFPSMKITPITYEEKFEAEEKKDIPITPVMPSTPDPNVNKLQIIAQPIANYTDIAREKNEQGIIRIRAKFSELGQITHIVGLKTLQFGLYRNAIFAALRIKFLPEEKNNKPILVVKTIEYRFTLY